MPYVVQLLTCEPQLQIKAGDFVDLVQRGFYTGCRAYARKAEWRRYSRFGTQRGTSQLKMHILTATQSNDPSQDVEMEGRGHASVFGCLRYVPQICSVRICLVHTIIGRHCAADKDVRSARRRLHHPACLPEFANTLKCHCICSSCLFP